ncbi:MAG: flavodoxin family protein [Pseudomonadota bacterium]
MKVVVINAAPRMEAGNTQMMLTPLLVGMRHEGAEVDVAFLGRKKIKPCIGCFTCYAKTPGCCVHADDMPGLIDRIRAAEMLVLAVPIYLDQVTSLAKIFIDRLVTFLDPHFEQDDQGLLHPMRWKFPPKLFLASVCGYPGMHNFDPVMSYMKKLARNLHTEFVGAMLRPAVFSCLMTHRYADQIRGVMEAARLLGQELGRRGKVSDELVKAVAADICSVEELRKAANAHWDREIDKHKDRPA